MASVVQVARRVGTLGVGFRESIIGDRGAANGVKSRHSTHRWAAAHALTKGHRLEELQSTLEHFPHRRFITLDSSVRLPRDWPAAHCLYSA